MKCYEIWIFWIQGEVNQRIAVATPTALTPFLDFGCSEKDTDCKSNN